MVTMTYYESKINTRLSTYYRIHLIAGGNIDNLLGGSILNSIGKLSKHEVIIAEGNKYITWKILEECSNLIIFGLGDTRISGSLPVYFSKLKMLRTLSIYKTMVSSEIPKEMGNCYGLLICLYMRIVCQVLFHQRLVS